MKENGITLMLKREPCMFSNNYVQKVGQNNHIDNTIIFFECFFN